MAKKDFTLTSKILINLAAAGDLFLVTPRELRKRLYSGNLLGDGKSFYTMVAYLARKGWIKYVNKGDSRFLKVTKAGQLEALLAKARMPGVTQKWDGKWRVVMFDIPEGSEGKRSFFRRLLKRNGYIKLQHSVYICPHPINREAVDYLKQTGLIGYIRMMKVEEMDNDKDLRVKFKLD